METRILHLRYLVIIAALISIMIGLIHYAIYTNLINSISFSIIIWAGMTFLFSIVDLRLHGEKVEL